jgi:amino acid transporter
VFIREATGLVRGFGGWDSFGFNFGGNVVVVGESTLFVTVGTLLGANILVSLLIVGPIILAYSIAYTQLGIAMPRSGSDYIYGSRIMHPSIGMLGSWMLAFLLVLNPAIFSDLIASGYVPGFLTALGMSSQAGAFSDLTVRLVLDSVIIAICVMFVVMPIRHYAKVQSAFIIASLLGALLVPIALFAIGHSGFIAAINARSPVSYDAVIAKAKSLGFAPSFSWKDSILAIPGLGFYLITSWPPAVGGELKNVKKTMPIGMIGGNMIPWVIFFATAGIYYSILGSDFASSVAFLALNSPANSPFGAPVFVTSILQYVYGSSWITFLIFISLIAACFIVIAQSILLTTRHVFAWSFDGVIPSKFASISDRFGTPVFTTMLIWIFSELVLLVTLYASSAVGLFLNAAVGVLMGNLPGLLSAMLFSRRRKDLFDNAPSTTRLKIGGVYLITIVGGITLVSFVTFLAFVLAFPQLGFGVTPVNMGFMVVAYLIGPAIFFISRYFRKKQGVNIDLVFKQIPPE